MPLEPEERSHCRYDESIARVDPVSALRTPIASGGFIAGEMDLVVALPEPASPVLLASGVLALLALARRRRG